MSAEIVKFDFSNNSRYTITIRNDRSAANFQGNEEIIHTWLVVTDTQGGPDGTPIDYAISYTAVTILSNLAMFENPFLSRLIYDARTTEALTLPLTEEQYEMLIWPGYLTDWLVKKPNFYLLGDVNHEDGINCTSITVEILKELDIHILDGFTTPNQIAAGIFAIADRHSLRIFTSTLVNQT
jgi:hypothetical protein